LDARSRARAPHENYLATIDTSTGVVTIIGRTVNGLDAIAFSTLQIPAPVGGVVVSVNKFAVLTPYIALTGLIIAVSAIVIKKRK